MKRIALLVEGFGDVDALPALVGRIAEAVGMHIIAPGPIRVGGLARLQQQGQLERYLSLAFTKPGIQAVVALVDLDDGCPVTTRSSLQQRANILAQQHGKPASICFAVREYECWLLQSLQTLRSSFPEYQWDENISCPNPERLRGAKELLTKAMGRRYREPVDQSKFTKRICARDLYLKDRSFRSFVKAVTLLDYDELDLLMS